MGKILAIANQKGGVGKTTTAVNLAAALQEAGHKTLLCDFDPQGNASSGLGVLLDKKAACVYDGVIGKADGAALVRHTEYCDLLPASIALAGAEIELVEMEKREYRLRELLTPLSFRYDFIIIDCPPSVGILTLNALTAADGVIVPMQCEYYALEGLSRLTETMRQVRRNFNPELEIEGILLTMYDGRTRLAVQVAEEVKRHFPRQILPVVVPRNVRLSEAPSHGQPVTAYDKGSRGAKCYRELAVYLAANR